MTITREWYESLEADAIELVDLLVCRPNASDEQLAECVDMLTDYSIDSLQLSADDRALLETSILELASRLKDEDSRPKFLRMHENVDLCARLRRFYEAREFSDYQHATLENTSYMPGAMFVDFERLAHIANPDFTASTIGQQYLEFANLIVDLEADPEGFECYAHLAIDPITTSVYLLEPSGSPVHIADDLDKFIQRLDRLEA